MRIGQHVWKKKVAVLAAVLFVTPAINAQGLAIDQGRYQNQLTRLSEILGQLHYLRGTCARGEQQLWRDNMMELIRLENPPSDRKNEMVAQFNGSFESARREFPDCGQEAIDEAVLIAREGSALSQVLSANISR